MSAGKIACEAHRDPQRTAADPGASVWVSASAGTGKTKVLTDRVLRLLLAGTAPGRILCITYTKAAAAEMALRIEDQLACWASAPKESLAALLNELLGRAPDEEELARAPTLLARVLDAPGDLAIETIHAFCQSLLARFPIEAGIAPHFGVAEERDQRDMLEAAQEEVLIEARKGATEGLGWALAELTALVAENDFRALMHALALARARLRELLRHHKSLPALVLDLYRRAGLSLEDTPEELTRRACQDDAFDGEGLRAAAAALATGSDKDMERSRAIARWLDQDESERAAALEDYARIFLTRECQPQVHIITKKAKDPDGRAAQALRTEQARIVRLYGTLKALGVCRSTQAALTLGAALLAAYQQVKLRHAVLDYDDQILLTRELLARKGIAPWVLYKLDGGIDHILLDEAQDTAPEQWEVIGAFAEEFFAGESARETKRTLFVVGDEKQSIFSFQGADPRILAQKRARFAALVTGAGERWEEVPLELSYRSTEPVLAAVDAVFAQEAARRGVALSGGAIRHSAKRKGEPGLVEVWPALAPREAENAAPWLLPLARRGADSPPARLAARIAGLIRRWLDEGEELEARGRPIRPGDVIVLVQRRGGFMDEMVRALKERAIPIAGADRLVLGEQIAVMDLMALGQFLLLPEDDLNLAALLKSPLVGLSEDELFALAYGRGEVPLWRALQRKRGESPAFAKACDDLSGLLARADFVPPFELYADALGRLGARRRLLERLGPEADDPIDEFLNAALDYQKSHAPSLQGFLHWLEKGASEIKRDLEQRRDEVRIMTVHGAKGLQAPIVFLPDTLRRPPALRQTPLWQGEGEDAQLLWAGVREREDDAAAAARAAEEERRGAEYRRLLYVAMTRAADRLYVAGFGSGRPAPNGSWYELIRGALEEAPGIERLPFDGGPGWSGETLRLASPQRLKPKREKGAAEPRPEEELPAFACTPAPPEKAAPRALAPSTAGAGEPPARSPLAGGESAYRRGQHVHRLLQLLPELPEERREEAARRHLARPGHGLSAAEQEEIAEAVLRVLRTPGFEALFGPESRAEAALAGVVGERLIAGRIDRLAVSDEAVLVVDYKTNREPPERPEEASPAYLAQLAAYRALLARIYPDKPIRSALLWTEGPRLMEIPEALLKAPSP